MGMPAEPIAPPDPEQITLALEEQLQRAHGIGRLEDADGPLPLHDRCDIQVPGDARYRMQTAPTGATIYARGTSQYDGQELTAKQVNARVLAYRALDPRAAHERDLAHAQRVCDWWRSSFDNDHRRLADPTHPAYRFTQRSIAHSGHYGDPHSAGHSRDRHSELLARALSDTAALRAGGPHLPAQASLF